MPVHQPCALIRPAGAYLGHFRHIVMVGHRFLGLRISVSSGSAAHHRRRVSTLTMSDACGCSDTIVMFP
ncbi:hypothetical protein J121_1414 [Qipengyuania citrea LAMA 915]|uniref:Uncharacterized protein n=1 Tax=Qipengyuania citrea LAMA 915 TaxID=1306953 RepID=A0A0L1KA41_9SPHN|nr:hypothetical protein J121_1414 [Qipengyuania citrea LAMA 915]